MAKLATAMQMRYTRAPITVDGMEVSLKLTFLLFVLFTADGATDILDSMHSSYLLKCTGLHYT